MLFDLLRRFLTVKSYLNVLQDKTVYYIYHGVQLIINSTLK